MGKGGEPWTERRAAGSASWLHRPNGSAEASVSVQTMLVTMQCHERHQCMQSSDTPPPPPPRQLRLQSDQLPLGPLGRLGEGLLGACSDTARPHGGVTVTLELKQNLSR